MTVPQLTYQPHKRSDPGVSFFRMTERQAKRWLYAQEAQYLEQGAVVVWLWAERRFAARQMGDTIDDVSIEALAERSV